MTGLFDRDEALGSGPEMPVMPNAAILAAGAHDQADRDAREITPYVWVHPDDER